MTDHAQTPGTVPAAVPGAPSPLAAEEAALREELAMRAQEIVQKINRGEITHGLPSGYRFEFTRAKEPHPIDAAFTAQVRGTAPEQPPDGFLVPGFAENLRKTIAELFGFPDMFEPPPPPTRRQQWKHKIADWRERTAKRAYRIIAGYWPSDGEDDW